MGNYVGEFYNIGSKMRILLILVTLLSSVVINTVVVTKSAQAGQCKIWFQGWRSYYGQYSNVVYPGSARFETPDKVLDHWLAWVKTAQPNFTGMQQDGPVHGDLTSYSNAVYYYTKYFSGSRFYSHATGYNRYNTVFAWKIMEYNGTFYDMNYFRIHLLERGRANCDTIKKPPVKELGGESCPNGTSPFVGNPIHAGNGNKFQIESDYSSNSANGVSLTRYYNSLDQRSGDVVKHFDTTQLSNFL